MIPRHRIAAIVAGATALLGAAHAAADPATGAGTPDKPSAEAPTSPAPTSPAAPASPAAPVNTPINYYKIDTPSHITTDGGTNLNLPPGYFLPDPAWDALDAEMRRLQDQETRLTAEVNSYKTTTSGWQPGWKVLVTTLAAGIVLGYEIDRHL